MDFPSNSRRLNDETEKETKETSKKIESVVVGEVVRRKKPLRKRISEMFVGGDARSVGSYVLLDVLVPAAKDMVADAMSQGMEKMLFGEARSRSRRGGSRSDSGNGYVSYNRFSPATGGRYRGDESRQPSHRARATHDFDEIILATRIEADEVIERLFDLVVKYESATVADLYELVGVSGNYTDDKWGWTDLRGAGVTRIRNGYLLELPKPQSLD
jgi:hypothetical protein